MTAVRRPVSSSPGRRRGNLAEKRKNSFAVIGLGAFGSTAVAAAAAPVALAAGGVAAAADGIKTISQGIRNHNTEQVVTGSIKTGAGAAMVAGVCTGNPILVAGGAITYGAAVVYENREAIGNWVSEKSHQVANVASNVVSGAADRLSSAGSAVSGAASSAWKWAFG